MALKGTFQRKYRKTGTGTTVFVYSVSGSEKELQEFENAEGDNFRLDDKTGKPIWFTTRFVDDSVSLIVTENGKVVADDSELSKLQSLVEQFGADVAKLVLLQKSMKTAE